MPTLVGVDGFEFQLFSTTTFGSGGTALYSTATNPTVETTVVHTSPGASLKFALSGTAGAVLRAMPASTRTLVVSFYLRFDTSLPGADTHLVNSTGPTNTPRMLFRSASSKLAMRWGTGTVTAANDFGAALSPDTWYRVDWKIDTSGATYTQTAQLDGANENTLTLATQTATDIATFGPGTNGAATVSCYFDDWVYGATLGDYPLGAHNVALLVPTSDGTHNAGTNVIEANGGADIGGGTTAYNLIDEVPPENTDYIQQSGAGSGNYAEVVFANPPSGTKWGIEYYCAVEGAAANASDLLLRVVDSGGSTLLDQGGAGAVSGTTRRYSRGFLAGDPSGNRGRVGFATDVSPVPRALTFVGQVAYVPSTGQTDFAGMIPL